MDSQETKIYIALLTGTVIITVLVIYFFVSIIRYHGKNAERRRGKMKSDINFADSERERIALDLHDGLGGSFSAMKLKLHRFRGLNQANEVLLESLEADIDLAMQKFRRISFNNLPDVLQRYGLEEALRELANDARENKFSVEYHFAAPHDLPGEVSLHVYRISQEIFHNIVKHSHARRVLLHLVHKKNKLLLRISDDGKGFDIAQLPPSHRGLGLQSISSRALLLKAMVYFTSLPGMGTEYQIEIPI